jgi:hypothetical protein
MTVSTWYRNKDHLLAKEEVQSLATRTEDATEELILAMNRIYRHLGTDDYVDFDELMKKYFDAEN